MFEDAIDRYGMQGQENEIVGRLFRELLNFEYQPDTEKTRNAIQNIINIALSECKYIGSDGKIIEAFINRFSVWTTNEKIIFNY